MDNFDQNPEQETQPQNENPTNLNKFVGPFWTEIFGDRDNVKNFVESLNFMTQQITKNLNEFCQSVNYHQTPSYHFEKFHKITLKESEKKKIFKNKFNDGFLYGNNETYGDFIEGAAAYPAPEGLIYFSSILSRPNNTDDQQGNYWIPGIDVLYDKKNNILIFPLDPLIENSKFVDSINGEKFLDIYLVNAYFDNGLVYKNTGHWSEDLYPEKEEQYRKTAKEISKINTKNSNSLTSVKKILGQALNTPCIEEDGEIVEKIIKTQESTTLITNKNTYVYPPNIEIKVMPGSVLNSGDIPINGVQVYERAPDYIDEDDLYGLAIPRYGLPQPSNSEVVFVNRDVELIPDGVTSGKLKVKFFLGGDPAYVTNLFNYWHNFGVSINKTIANILDRRENTTYETNASMLPAVINPMMFLLQKLITSPIFMSVINSSSVYNNNVRYHYLEQIKNHLPPNTVYFNFIKLDDLNSDIDDQSIDDNDYENYTF